MAISNSLAWKRISGRLSVILQVWIMKQKGCNPSNQLSSQVRINQKKCYHKVGLGSKFSLEKQQGQRKASHRNGNRRRIPRKGKAYCDPGRAYIDQTQSTSNRHSVFRTGTAYLEEAQRVSQKRARKFKVATRVQVHVLKRDRVYAK